jgi:hypothetical protein
VVIVADRDAAAAGRVAAELTAASLVSTTVPGIP